MTPLPQMPRKPPYRLRDWLFGLGNRHPILTGSVRRCPSCGAVVCRPNREDDAGFEFITAPGLRGDVFVWVHHECHDQQGNDLSKLLPAFFMGVLGARADDQAAAERRRFTRLYDPETIAN